MSQKERNCRNARRGISELQVPVTNVYQARGTARAAALERTRTHAIRRVCHHRIHHRLQPIAARQGHHTCSTLCLIPNDPAMAGPAIQTLWHQRSELRQLGARNSEAPAGCPKPLETSELHNAQASDTAQSVVRSQRGPALKAHRTLQRTSTTMEQSLWARARCGDE